MSFTGAISEIPIGLDGLSGGKNFAVLKPGNLLEANNITYESGTIKREGGSAKYNSTPFGVSIVGGVDWWPSPTLRRLTVVLSDGRVFFVAPANSFTGLGTLANGVTNQLPTFVEGGKESAGGNRKLFIFTGANSVQVINGGSAVMANIASPPADWSGTNQPTGGAIHENRLWGWGNANDPHRVYASLSTNHEDFTTTAFTIAVFPGEGEKIVAGLSFKGALILVKYPVGVYAIDTSSPTTTDWHPIRISYSGGGISAQCMVQTDDDILYMDRDGNFQLLSATQAFGDLVSRNLSTLSNMNEYVRNNINTGHLQNTRAVYYAAKREAHFAVPAAGQTTNNRRIVVDFNRPDVARFRVSDKDTSESLWIGKETQYTKLNLMSGDNLGYLWNLDQDLRAKDGVAYISQFQTVHSDLSYVDQSLAAKRKIMEFLELVVEQRSASTLYVDVVLDGKNTQTVAFDMGGVVATWDQVNWDGFNWVSDEIVRRKKRITGSGINLSLIFRNAIVYQDFSIIKALLYFHPADERVN